MADQDDDGVKSGAKLESIIGSCGVLGLKDELESHVKLLACILAVCGMVTLSNENFASSHLFQVCGSSSEERETSRT